jgi:hypothetical protein
MELRTGNGRLNELIGVIENQISSIASFSNDQLISLIKQFNLTVDDLASYQAFDHPLTESYGRKVVYHSDRLKVMVMSWNSGDFTAIHDHQPAMTLHIYGTDSRFSDEKVSRIYEVEKGRVILTDGSAFIDRNEEDYLVLNEEIAIDPETLRDYQNLIRPIYLRRSGSCPF